MGASVAFPSAAPGANVDITSLRGTSTNDSAAAGKIGELIQSEILIANQVALTTLTDANVTSISLTAGDWDVEGIVSTAPAAGAATALVRGWISSTSATSPAAPNAGGYFQLTGTLSGSQSVPLISKRFSLANTTTIYLSTLVSFTINTMGAYGYIRARRVR